MTKVRLKRLNQIVDCVVEVGGAGASRKQIADCLKIKVSSYLTTMLNQCVTEGYLKAWLDDEVYPPAWKYEPTEKAVV